MCTPLGPVCHKQISSVAILMLWGGLVHKSECHPELLWGEECDWEETLVMSEVSGRSWTLSSFELTLA